MRFLANENFPLMSVGLLRAAGHSVVAIAEDSPGIYVNACCHLLIFVERTDTQSE